MTDSQEECSEAHKSQRLTAVQFQASEKNSHESWFESIEKDQGFTTKQKCSANVKHDVETSITSIQMKMGKDRVRGRVKLSSESCSQQA